MSISRRAASDGASEKETKSGHSRPQVGFIPGRSFVGRVLECGWEVCDEVARRGEWVVGLLDVRKSGALAEFITADRHRIHRVPHPQSHANGSQPTAHSSSDGHLHSHSNQYPAPPAAAPPPGPTLEELALLPFALTAYRAVRTLIGLEGFGTGVRRGVGAVSPEGEPEVDSMSEERHRKGRSAAGRRALVLNGHTGTGAFVARMLAARGWRVCVHAPGTLSDAATGCTEADKAHMATVQARTRAWGVEEVVFDDGGGVGDGEDWGQGAAVRAIEQLIEDGDAFDAVVDTIGGRTVWEAGQRLLVCAADGGRKQFTTTVGDSPERPVPSAMDNFRLGLRAMRGSQSESTKKEKGSKARTNVSYAWVSVAQDVDWEGGDVRDGLGVLVQMALEAGMRPVVENQLPFERAVDVFEGREDPAMRHGGSVVVKVVG
ncbi:hypothetical protein GGX14DRAFT_346422 [Mycena pura]|uniref:Enoyl reductase (ER) domain-containing protein n=1 Tax=Mycena pura TaxID=153505 RepID=A0AAD6YUJ7_9AGAR|nr:hypothetical protein GGX14DRAFT_346422 [Mycena pura]